MDTEALTKRDIALLGLSQRTGLTPLTCEDLTQKGWILIEELNKPRRWVQMGNHVR
jgi:hypothetical protein